MALTLSPESDHWLAEQRLMAAVEGVYGEYKDEIEKQYAAATNPVRAACGRWESGGPTGQ